MQAKPLGCFLNRLFPYYDVEVPRLETYLGGDAVRLTPERFNLHSTREVAVHYLDDRHPWSNLQAIAQLVRCWHLNGMAGGNIPTEPAVAFQRGRMEEYAHDGSGKLSTDVLVGALRFWLEHTLFDTDIVGFVSVDVRHQHALRFAINQLGGVLVGVSLPMTSVQQTRLSLAWTRPFGEMGESAPGSWGRHTVALLAYGPSGFVAPTFGRYQRMTYDWAESYFEEAYVPIRDARLTHLAGDSLRLDVPGLRRALACQRIALLPAGRTGVAESKA